jgi:hypothetical protein
MLQIVLKGIQYHCQAIERAQSYCESQAYQKELAKRIQAINKMTTLACKLTNETQDTSKNSQLK